MRKAFGPSGALSDANSVESEKEALAHLFPVAAFLEAFQRAFPVRNHIGTRRAVSGLTDAS